MRWDGVGICTINRIVTPFNFRCDRGSIPVITTFSMSIAMHGYWCFTTFHGMCIPYQYHIHIPYSMLPYVATFHSTLQHCFNAIHSNPGNRQPWATGNHGQQATMGNRQPRATYSSSTRVHVQYWYFNSSLAVWNPCNIIAYRYTRCCCTGTSR